MLIPDSVLCSKTHEYIYKDGNCFKIGLTDYAIEQMGDIVFIEFPEVYTCYSKGDVFATIESVKAASEIYMPISGKIKEVNEFLLDNPDILSESPFEKGWLVKIEADNFDLDSQDLLDYNDYKEELN